jgi:N-acetylmuramoyl-L-alanine amidase
MLRTVRLLGAAVAITATVPTAQALGAVHTVTRGETLWGIAAANGMSPATIAAANGLSADAPLPIGTNLTIPAAGTVGTTTGTAGTSSASSTSSAGGVTVAPGDTLSDIAARNGTSVSALAAANGLDPNGILPAGRTLRLPGGGTAAPATSASSTGGGLIVQRGDTLSDIAARNGVSVSALAAANGLDPNGILPAGRSLHIPAAGTSAAAPASAPEAIGAYTVRPGDTLSALAARSGVPVAQMAFMNGLDPNGLLRVGTVIKLPTGSPVSASTPAPSSTVVPSAAPAATPGHLSAGEIGSIAAQQGVPGSLAAAIAWQESGFNNGAISGANARGIMQILPGTWDWVQANLSRTRLDPNSPSDNVKAGSLYLGQLLRDTGGDPEQAAAAYYQGLSSVRRIGMLPETRRYVANVMALRSRFGG